jgi:outer membrane lipoprotein-sorting protein
MKSKFLFIVFLALSQWAIGQDAKEIIKRMEDNMRGDFAYMELEMTIVRPKFTREMGMKSWSRGENFSIILITSPARDKGTAFLKRNKEIWNYMPSIERMIKMPPSMMSQSWMGSDFTNDDLVRESSNINDYEQTILRTETYNNRPCYVVQLVPKPNAAVVYAKVIMWVDKEKYIQLKVENYDEYGDLANSVLFSDVKNLGGKEIPCKMELIPTDKKGNRTIMIYKAADFKTDIPESFFSVQNLKQLR